MDRERREKEMSETELTLIPVDLLLYSGRNPRTEMRSLEELAENIKEYGVLEPIIVRPREEKFEVVVGERRVRASMLAGMKEIPAIIRAITDRQADELRLIENIHREDLTDAEKGDAIYALLENYPDKYLSMASIAEKLTMPYNTILKWCRYSRKVSDFVKDAVGSARLGEDHVGYLMKYDHATQDKLAKVIIERKMTSTQAREFFRLYSGNPEQKLDEIADDVMGIKRVRISLHELSEEARREVQQILAKKKEQTKTIQTDAIKKKMRESRKLTEQRKKEARKRFEQKKAKSEVSLLPEEEERLEKVKEREIGKIIREREKRGEFMQARAELREEKIELPLIPTMDASVMLSRRNVADEKRLNLFEAKDWMIFTKSWFIHNPPPRDEKEELHPAKFPEPLIKNFVEFFTQPTEIVLDPFLGTGSALVACDMSNRQGIGVELEERYADVARRRTKQPVIVGDARNLDELDILKDLKGKIDFAITSPPYWNMLKKSRGHVRSVSKIREELGADVFYGGKMENLENVENYEEYLNALHLIFSKVHKLLRPNRYLVVIIQNILTEDGEMKPVAWDLAKRLNGLFLLKQERIWCQDNKPLGCWGYPYRYVSNVHHHYCLVFEKVEA